MALAQTAPKVLLPLAFALALASCAEEEPTYEAGATDVSGGELIVTDPEAPAVEDVELPETPMTPVPADAEAAAAEPAPQPAE